MKNWFEQLAYVSFSVFLLVSGPATAVAWGLAIARPLSLTRAVPRGAVEATPPVPAKATAIGWAWATLGSSGLSDCKESAIER